ncbi:MAG: flagellar biosynthesis anti-sigma factor FlgM [Nitrospirae bacterium CG_4_8_14_3_um_filter_70_85]|nr:MAG: flagellar biosynthesis anti-sigma factor FlgM [Nitrospirae bacterium CG_4_8_14_3_um_filter_70_85]PIX82459.1 MAG: flagellar biosynthesis anti-sigma factor FlgM [Nitrospirae bacterium CG_4_10_14_3_um_filter_70_108]HBB41500.1 flagellar biosynthesis anti-sigma factor FlgM [Pseudomonadota bacterium]
MADWLRLRWPLRASRFVLTASAMGLSSVESAGLSDPRVGAGILHRHWSYRVFPVASVIGGGGARLEGEGRESRSRDHSRSHRGAGQQRAGRSGPGFASSLRSAPAQSTDKVRPPLLVLGWGAWRRRGRVHKVFSPAADQWPRGSHGRKTMKIGSGNNNKKVRTGNAAPTAKAGKSGKAGGAAAAGRSHAGADHMEISGHAREVQQALDLATAAPEIRTAKVEPLKQAVADGTYYRPSDAIAERIVEEMKRGPG